MQQIGGLVKQRFDQVVIQNQILRSGFAAFPYLVMTDKKLSVGARLTYAFLLMYAWQEGSCFAGQDKMAEAMKSPWKASSGLRKVGHCFVYLRCVPFHARGGTLPKQARLELRTPPGS